MFILTEGCLGVTNPLLSSKELSNYALTFSLTSSLFIISIALLIKYGVATSILSLAICILLLNCSLTFSFCKYLFTPAVVIFNSLQTFCIFPPCFLYTLINSHYLSVNCFSLFIYSPLIYNKFI
jgi:hypothetical protein